jgi:hypothetical protein
MALVTLDNIAHHIRETIRGGRASNNDPLSIEQIRFAVKHYRSLIIRRDAESNNSKLEQFEQDLGFIKLEIVNSSTDSSLNPDETFRRTTSRLPNPIRLKHKEGFTHIGWENSLGKPIPLEAPNKSYWNQFNKFTSNSAYAFYRDGYLYISDEDNIGGRINVRGVFEDPEEVFNFTATSNIDFYDPSEEFPMPSDLIEGITKALINGELSAILATNNDNQTNLN